MPTLACILHHAEYFEPARNPEKVQVFAGTKLKGRVDARGRLLLKLRTVF